LFKSSWNLCNNPSVFIIYIPFEMQLSFKHFDGCIMIETPSFQNGRLHKPCTVFNNALKMIARASWDRNCTYTHFKKCQGLSTTSYCRILINFSPPLVHISISVYTPYHRFFIDHPYRPPCTFVNGTALSVSYKLQLFQLIRNIQGNELFFSDTNLL
jgi:hypothetical protein